VLYAGSGAHVCACVQEDKPINLEINGQSIHINKFIAESKTYYFETSNALEAFYLISILNSPSIDKMIKSMKEGLRDIHKKVLELPIPQFDSSNDIHLRLAEWGKLCSQKVTEWLKSEDQGKIKSIGRLRLKVREILKEELREIDALVQQILR
jgi:hypothetical protein